MGLLDGNYPDPVIRKEELSITRKTDTNDEEFINLHFCAIHTTVILAVPQSTYRLTPARCCINRHYHI